MDPFLRRVYFSVAGVLIILWAGMFSWAVMAMKSDFLAFISAPAPIHREILENSIPLVHVPGVRFSLYQTASGETFYGIAAKFNLLETTLRSLNQSNDDSQPPAGTSLLIPSKDGIFHCVRPGQGLADLSRAYGAPLRGILGVNHKKGDLDLQAGDVLYLPGASYLSRKDIRWISLCALEVKKGFLKPTTGRFADGFGQRIHPISGKPAFHEGLDLAPGWRARVVASQDGKVVFAGLKAGYGRLIILDHEGGVTSWYAHLDEILVKPQQEVKRGDLIGKVGNSGKTTGPHLHFEVRLNGKPQNPLLYLVQ